MARPMLWTLGILLAVAIACWMLTSMSFVVVVASLVIVLALAISPVVDRLDASLQTLNDDLTAAVAGGRYRGKKIFASRVLAIVATYGLLGLLLMALGATLLPEFVEQVRDFSDNLPAYMANLNARLQLMASLIQQQLPDSVRADSLLVTLPPGVLEAMDVQVSTLAGRLLSLGSYAVETLITLLFVLMVLFYTLLDGPHWWRSLAERARPAVGLSLVETLSDTRHMLMRQLRWGMVLGLFLYALLWLLEVRFAGFLATVFGVMSVLPILGPWLGLLPVATVLALSNWQFFLSDGLFAGVPLALYKLFCVLLVVCMLYVIKYMRRRRNWCMHPLAYLLVLLLCLYAFGAWGAFVSLPAAMLILFATSVWGRLRPDLE